MEQFQCEMCGNTLENSNNTNVAICERCRMQQTLPKLDDKPFDVFICYKENDNSGRRTPDSALANDLYHQLTQEGFKVFFARITLEEKTNLEKETYVYAALNSARVMVVLGTNAEFFHDAWVKREWSQYLELMKQGKKKILIPVCMGMNSQDVPQEFFCFQELDMFKQGFMQELIRRITRADDFQIKVEEMDANARWEGLYNKARRAMDVAATESSYKAAAELFASIREYRDSAALLEVCYENAERQAKRDKMKKIVLVACICTIVIAAIVAVKHVMLERTKEIFRNGNVGDTVLFGEYEQDDEPFNGEEEIEWIILEKNEGRVLIISKHTLDTLQYHTSGESVTWEMCALRKWLNDDFLIAAFSGIEKSIVDTVTVSADRNPKYNTNPGNTTQDKVFLLSVEEADEYLDTEEKRQCAGWWWLRTPGGVQDNAAYVRDNGSIREYGLGVDNYNGGVRPAMWIDLKS